MADADGALMIAVDVPLEGNFGNVGMAFRSLTMLRGPFSDRKVKQQKDLSLS